MASIDAEAAKDWKAPLQIPAVEVVDLSSEGTVEPPDHETTRDALESKISEDDVNEAADGDGDGDDDDDWSIYEELINSEDSEGEPNGDIPDSFTLEESLALRKRLRLIGGERFFDETVGNGSIEAKKLITAFGIRPPAFLEGCPDVLYCKLLELGIARELSKRVKLPQYNTLDDAVALLKKSQNIIVLTGAGISTSLGIPDFRSKETGLYAQLAHLGLSDPQEVFDISLFREDPSIFYSVAKDILPSSSRYSPTHAFIRLLQDQGKLLTNFTQNIDNLESAAGIRPEKLIQCHGSFATATCIECGHHVPGARIHSDLAAGRVSRCEACVARLRDSRHPQPRSLLSVIDNNNKKRKRSPSSSTTRNKKKKKRRQQQHRSHDFDTSSDDDDDDDPDTSTAGVMKPDITFFGEALPSTFSTRLLSHDRDMVDLVIVIGTSLKVAPVSEVVAVLPGQVPQLYISREPCAHVEFDVDLLGDCDVVVAELCRRAGWSLRHEMLVEEEEEEEGGGQKVVVEGVEGYESRFRIEKVGKGGEGKRSEVAVRS